MESLTAEQFSMSVVEPIEKFSLWPITKHTDKTMNQSKLEPNTCSRGKARERCASHVRVTMGFGVTSNWMEKWRKFLNPIAWHGNEHQRKDELLSTIE